jgi:hypothetical protein
MWLAQAKMKYFFSLDLFIFLYVLDYLQVVGFSLTSVFNRWSWRCGHSFLTYPGLPAFYIIWLHFSLTQNSKQFKKVCDFGCQSSFHHPVFVILGWKTVLCLTKLLIFCHVQAPSPQIFTGFDLVPHQQKATNYLKKVCYVGCHGCFSYPVFLNFC